MQDRRLDVSTNGHRDDDAMMRAVFEALDGGRTGPAGEAPAPDDSHPRPAPHLRVVAAEPAADPATGAAAAPAGAPVPKRPRAKGAERPRRPETTPAPAAATPEAPQDAAPDAPTEAEAEALRAIIGAEPSAEDAPARPVAERLRAEWARWRPLRPFLVATLAPVPFLLLAGAAGGLFSLLALLWMTGVLYAIDEVLKRRGVEGPAPMQSEMADRLSLLLAGLHFALLLFAVWALSGATGLGPLSWLGTFLAFGLWFGQVSNSNAHELIHRTDSRLFRTGMWVYISLLFGHHTSAHRLVHHRFVATADDPNTAAEGEGFWSFAARAWPGALVAGYEMEAHRRGTREAGSLRGMNPYTVYAAGAAGFAALMLTLFGFDGLLAYLLLCAHAQLQLLLSDYVQHYGLERRKLPSGALEPAGLQHSWDAPHPFSGLLMLNAPRHADHHAHPGRPWPELRLSPQGRAPLLPYSLPVMATIALVPPVWHRVMDRRVARLRKAA
jgi:alkane 1-monooxygenase